MAIGLKSPQLPARFPGDEAPKQIDIAAYVLTDRAVIDARNPGGVKVQIWRERTRSLGNNTYCAEPLAIGQSTQFKDRQSLTQGMTNQGDVGFVNTQALDCSLTSTLSNYPFY